MVKNGRSTRRNKHHRRTTIRLPKIRIRDSNDHFDELVVLSTKLRKIADYLLVDPDNDIYRVVYDQLDRFVSTVSKNMRDELEILIGTITMSKNKANVPAGGAGAAAAPPASTIRNIDALLEQFNALRLGK